MLLRGFAGKPEAFAVSFLTSGDKNMVVMHKCEHVRLCPFRPLLTHLLGLLTKSWKIFLDFAA